MEDNLQTQQLENIRRQFFGTALKVYASLVVLFTIISGVAFFVFQTPGLMWYALAGVTLLVGSAITFWMLNQRAALSLAVLPISFTIFLVGIVDGILIPEVQTTLLFLLILVILFGSFIGHRRVAIMLSVMTIIITILIISLPRSTLTQPLGVTNVFLAPAGLSAILLVIWLIADRNARSQENMITLVHERALEAEHARALAEHAQREAEQRFSEQQRLLEVVQSLELPVISLGADILASPLVGNVDSHRLEAIQKRLLEMIVERHARIVILDVTGLSVIDTAVAHGLLNTAQAVRLLGAQTLISGIGATIAQTLAALGVDFAHIHTVSDMGQALAYAEQQLAESRMKLKDKDTGLLR